MEVLSYAPCRLCPRQCAVDRHKETGYCGMGSIMLVSKTMLHYFEEPCIAREGRGSGAIFFTGCALRCVYCRNKAISHIKTRCPNEEISRIKHPDRARDKAVTPRELAKIMLSLQEEGADNIDLVTPTHFAAGIIEALELCRKDLRIPVVWNTSGYERPEVLEALKNHVSIFLTDFKYADPSLAKRCSAAEDYPRAAREALIKMVEITGPRVFEKGLLKRGTLVRHLVLPGAHHDSLRVLELIEKCAGTESVVLSLLSQYTPDFAPDDYRELKRRITTYEYEKVLEKAQEMGFEGYQQQRSAAKAAFTPDFDFAGEDAWKKT